MQVTLLANATWLDEELNGFRHLTVGLFDEQVRVAQVVPDNLPLSDAMACGERIPWNDTAWPWLRKRRLMDLADRLESLEPDVIHILHHTLWDGGLRLAEEVESAVVLQVSSDDDITAAERVKRDLDPTRVAFAASTQPLARAVAELVTADFTVKTIKPGVRVSTPGQPSAMAAPAAEPPLCAIISGRQKHDAHYESLFAAIKRLVADYRDVQFFLDTATDGDPSLWKAARKHEILPNLSMVPHRLGHRELELAADVIIHPQAMNRSRSMTLQAMANGIPVIAHRDRWLDYLIDDQTAWIVEEPKSSRWEEMLRHLIIEPNQGEALGARARQWVGQHHLVSHQITETVALYRKLAGEAIKFPG